MQLNKYLSQSGICSRRKAVILIEDGLVTVNSHVVTNPAHRVSPSDAVALYGNEIKSQSKIYIMLNKPKDYITTAADEAGRRTVIDLLGASLPKRVYSIGRLDRNTTGLLLLTNDGELAQRLSHPRYKIEKTYAVTVKRNITYGEMERIRDGVRLYDGIVNIDAISYIPGGRRNQVYVTLHSGKNRVVRRLFEALGHEVNKLDRVVYAGMEKTGLAPSKWRYLATEEIMYLKDLCGLRDEILATVIEAPKKKKLSKAI